MQVPKCPVDNLLIMCPDLFRAGRFAGLESPIGARLVNVARLAKALQIVQGCATASRFGSDVVTIQKRFEVNATAKAASPANIGIACQHCIPQLFVDSRLSHDSLLVRITLAWDARPCKPRTFSSFVSNAFCLLTATLIRV